MSDLGGDELFVLDAASHAVVRKLDLGGGSAGLQMDPNGKRAFVSVGSTNSVAVMDLTAWKITGRIDSDPGPDGLAWADTR